jgi:hypothetical protein
MLKLCAHGHTLKILVALLLAAIDILKLLLPPSSTSTITYSLYTYFVYAKIVRHKFKVPHHSHVYLLTYKKYLIQNL